VGTANCWRGWSGCAAHWPPRGCSRRTQRRLPFLPGCIGRSAVRDSAPQRDVQQNAARRWPRCDPGSNSAVQGAFAVALDGHEALSRLDAESRRGCDQSSPGRRVGSRTSWRSPTRRCSVPSPPAGPRWSARSGMSRTPRCWTWSPTSGLPRRTEAARRVVAGRDEQLRLIAQFGAPAPTGSSRAGWTGSNAWLDACDPARARRPDTRHRPATEAGDRGYPSAAAGCWPRLLDRAADDMGHLRRRCSRWRRRRPWARLRHRPAAGRRRGSQRHRRQPGGTADRGAICPGPAVVTADEGAEA